MKRMKKLLFIVVLLMISVISVIAGSAKLAVQENVWQVNTFRSKNCKAKLSYVKAPSGKAAVKVAFAGKKMASISLKKNVLRKQVKKWPKEFNGLIGYFWNDGKQNWLRLCFKQKNTKGKFTAFIKMNHKGWKRLNVPKVVNLGDRSKKLKFFPDKTTGFHFSLYPLGRKSATVGFGSLSWKMPGAELTQQAIGNNDSIKKAQQAPVLDGELNDKIWTQARELQLKHKSTYKSHPETTVPSNKGWVKAAFDDKNLYLAGRFDFPKGSQLKDGIKEFDAGLWSGDDIEFFVFPGYDKRQYYQLIVNPAGTRADLANIFDPIDDRIRQFYKDWNGNWQAKTRKYDDHWTVEIIVPWKTLKVDSPPDILQFQAQRADYSGKKREISMWSPARIKAMDTLGSLDLSASTGQPVNIDDISLFRISKNELNLDGTITADKAIGELVLKAWYFPPSAPAKEFVKTIKSNNKQCDFSWKLDVGNCVNGSHKLVLKAVPASPVLASSCVDYHFNQVMPSDVKFADVFLNPIPKKLKWGKGKYVPNAQSKISIATGASPRTEKTARFLIDKLYGHFGLKPAVVRGGQGAIKLSINKEKVKQETGTDWREAYLLDITPEGIEIIGAGEAGLYYGVVTLGQMLNASKQPNTPLKAASIKDCPTYKTRIDQVYQQFHCKKSVNGSKGYRIKRIKEWILKMVAGNKFNSLPFIWADQVNYPSQPQLHHPNNFSPEEVSEIFSFAREHFIDVFPGAMMGGHSTSWTKHYPEIIEKKFGKKQMDVTNPKVYELMNDIFNDLLKMSGPKTKYFHTCNDEWWHKSQLRNMQNFVYKGKNRQELLRDFLLTEYKILKKNNVRMVMLSDMIHPQHNGRPPWNLSKVAKELPRDIIIDSWGPSNEYFSKLGFKETGYVGNGFTADFRKPFKGNKRFGTLRYLSIDSLFNHSNLARWLHYCFHTELQAANYAWNGEEKPALPMPEWTMRYMPNLMGTYSTAPNPMAGNKLSPVELKGKSKVAVNLKQEDVIGDIPMKLNAVEVLSGKLLKVEFKKPEKISSLYILDCVAVKDKKVVKKLQKEFKNNSGNPYGLKIGQYVLHYKDGTKASHDILLGRNIALFKNAADPACRYVKEGRCLYPLKNDQSEALLQIEWVNPHPEKAVTAFEVVNNNPDAPIIICGLTTRNTKGK